MMIAARRRFSIFRESIYKFAASRNRYADVLIHPKWTLSYRRSYVLSNSLNGRPFEEERMFTNARHGFALEEFYD
jgi:hypothetical protein